MSDKTDKREQDGEPPELDAEEVADLDPASEDANQVRGGPDQGVGRDFGKTSWGC
jgi:hypothetical protein